MDLLSHPVFWIALAGLALLGRRFWIAICLPENHWLNDACDSIFDRDAGGECGGDGGD
ncbi:MAG: hypothetical protein QNJ44_17125 [Rhodobacter sp.]|nr:hypothetical protein [Rhodobacter sp.]